MKIIKNIAVVLCLAATCDAGQEVIQYAKTRDIATLSHGDRHDRRSE